MLIQFMNIVVKLIKVPLKVRMEDKNKALIIIDIRNKAIWIKTNKIQDEIIRCLVLSWIEYGVLRNFTMVITNLR